jgi:hypothetical protein
MFRITSESHTDHNLTLGHLELIRSTFRERTSFFAEVIDIPENLASLPSALHGPTMGDEPVLESEVYYERRGTRTWVSRMVRRAPRMVRKMVVIAGPQSGPTGPDGPGGIILYTAYGGLIASPREPGDPDVIKAGGSELARCTEFWKVHALNPE